MPKKLAGSKLVESDENPPHLTHVGTHVDNLCNGPNICKKEGKLFAADTSRLDGRRIPVEADKTLPLPLFLIGVHCPSAPHLERDVCRV